MGASRVSRVECVRRRKLRFEHSCAFCDARVGERFLCCRRHSYLARSL